MQLFHKNFIPCLLLLFLLLLVLCSAGVASANPTSTPPHLKYDKEEESTNNNNNNNNNVGPISISESPTPVVSSLSSSHMSSSSNMSSDILSSSGELMPRYGFRPPSMALLLHSNGNISAHHLHSGAPLWTVSTGGGVLSAAIEQRPREAVAHRDPLALPFIIEGDMIFTRRRFKSKEEVETRLTFDSSSSSYNNSNSNNNNYYYYYYNNYGEKEEGDGVNPGIIPLSPLHPHYFMNLSSLIRRQHVNLNGTDIFVTTSARIMDFSSHNGNEVLTSDILIPYLHVVRYNITINVQRRGEYSWQMGIAKFKISEGSTLRVSEDTEEEKNPRFLSRKLHYSAQREEFKNNNNNNNNNTKEKGNLELLLDISRKGNIANLLTVKEITLRNYILWNTFSNTPLWNKPIETVVDIADAFVWSTYRGIIQRVPIIHIGHILTSSASASSSSSSNLPLTYSSSFGIPFISTSTSEGVKSEIIEQRLRLPFISDIQCSEDASSNRLFGGTWEEDDDISADERETRELESSYEKCYRVYGFGDSSGIEKNLSPLNKKDLLKLQSSSTPQNFIEWLVSTFLTFYMFNFICLISSVATFILGVLDRKQLSNAWTGQENLMEEFRKNKKPDSNSNKISKSKSNSTKNGITMSPEVESSIDFNQENQESPLGSINEEETTDTNDAWWKNTGDDDDDEDISVSEKQTTDIATVSEKNNIHPRVFQQHFNILKKIGYGAEGSVFCVEHQVTKAKYAIKAIRILSEDQQKYVREAVLHSRLDDSNVVRYFNSWIEYVPSKVVEKHGILLRNDTMDSMSVCTEESSLANQNNSPSLTSDYSYTMLFIQTEYFERGTLADYLKQRNELSRRENLEHFIQLAKGLQYLHENQVIHRDLKPTNIFVSDTGIMKIGDFGLAKKRLGNSNSLKSLNDALTSTAFIHQEEISVGGGSPLYWSPEQQRGEVASYASDIYSLGIIAVELYSLFNTMHERIRTLEEARCGQFKSEIINNFPEEAKLIAGMLCEGKEHRVGLGEVVQTLQQTLRRVRNNSLRGENNINNNINNKNMHMEDDSPYGSPLNRRHGARGVSQKEDSEEDEQ